MLPAAQDSSKTLKFEVAREVLFWQSSKGDYSGSSMKHDWVEAVEEPKNGVPRFEEQH